MVLRLSRMTIQSPNVSILRLGKLGCDPYFMETPCSIAYLNLRNALVAYVRNLKAVRGLLVIVFLALSSISAAL